MYNLSGHDIAVADVQIHQQHDGLAGRILGGGVHLAQGAIYCLVQSIEHEFVFPITDTVSVSSGTHYQRLCLPRTSRRKRKLAVLPDMVLEPYPHCSAAD